MVPPKKKTNDNYITLMLLPHFSGKPIFSLKLKQSILYTFVILLGAMLLIFFLSLFYSSSLTRKLINYSSLIAQTKYHQYQINLVRKKIATLDIQLRDLMQKDQQLRGIIGMSPSTFSPPAHSEVKKKINEYQNLSIEKLQLLMDQILVESRTRESSYDFLTKRIHEFQLRFAHTPSIIPLIGSLSAGFGFRRHPFSGGVEFHRGIDIMTWMGAPIKAAADGIVEKADWNYGYGRTVIIDHQHGLKTLYGHTSRFLVREGMQVKKGQLIAEAGSTGMSTGVHLHYEVHRGETVISPAPYLNLTLLTALKSNYW